MIFVTAVYRRLRLRRTYVLSSVKLKSLTEKCFTINISRISTKTC